MPLGDIGNLTHCNIAETQSPFTRLRFTGKVVHEVLGEEAIGLVGRLSACSRLCLIEGSQGREEAMEQNKQARYTGGAFFLRSSTLNQRTRFTGGCYVKKSSFELIFLSAAPLLSQTCKNKATRA